MPDRDDCPAFYPTLDELVRRAQAGDQSVLPQLRQLLEEQPMLWQAAGDLARQAEIQLVELAAGPDLLLREALPRQLAELRQQLAEAADGKLHHLLVERVVLCWLELHHLDLLITQLRARFGTPAQIEALERRRNYSQNRYLAAIRALANLRKLLRQAPSPLELLSQPTGQRSASTTRTSAKLRPRATLAFGE